MVLSAPWAWPAAHARSAALVLATPLTIDLADVAGTAVVGAAGDGEPLVEVCGLVARYGDRTVLDGVDVAIPRGEIHVVLGGSGSGKSTLLKHMIGLLSPSAGDVRLLGQDLPTLGEAAREGLLCRIGVLFQGGALLEALDIAGNVALPIAMRHDVPPAVLGELVRMKLDPCAKTPQPVRARGSTLTKNRAIIKA